MSLPTICLTCRFFLGRTTGAFPETDGMCRRNAPRGPVIGSQSTGWQIFPPMLSHQWCGQYEEIPGLREAWTATQHKEGDRASAE